MKTTAMLTQPAKPVPTVRGPGTASPDTGSRLSVLWIFYMFNAAYIDITTLYYSVFVNHKPTVHYSQVFLLGAAVLIEISIGMVLLSRVLSYRANRRANITTGLFLTVVQFATLFVGAPTLAYLFFSVILVATSVVIARCAWRWVDPELGLQSHANALNVGY